MRRASDRKTDDGVSFFTSTVVVAVYVDSFLFVFVTAILKYGLGVNSAHAVCDAAILLCLIGYVSTKVS